MEFYLKHDETVGDGIQRIIREQIDYASGLLKDSSSDRDIAIHECRKTFKKIRALLRLVQAEFGKKNYQHENIPYRDVGRTLAPLRDSYVLIEVLDKVKLKTSDKTIRAAATIVRRSLMKNYRATRKSILSGDVILTTIAELERGCERIADWSFQHEDFAAIEAGLKRTYKRGQKAMAAGYQEPHSPELFHEWRKRTKDLWYQTLILMPIWPAVMPSVAEQIHVLSEILGNAHDLAVLYQTIRPSIELETDGIPALLKLIADEQAAAEQSAQPLGSLIYAESAGGFVERFAAYWQVWRQSADSLTLYIPEPQPL